MQMMNYHKDTEQDRIKFELSILLMVLEESYNSKKTNGTSFGTIDAHSQSTLRQFLFLLAFLLA